MKRITWLLGTVAVVGSLLAPTAYAQSDSSAYTYATRYDLMNRVTGTIAPDPDGAGGLRFAATRTTYDIAGRPIKVDTGELSGWQSEDVLPVNWAGFTVLSSVETSYDALGRKTSEISRGSDNLPFSVVQYSYDAVGRLECTAQRMNPAAWATLPMSACTIGTAGSYGSDRITRNYYDPAGQLSRVQKAHGTALQQDTAIYTYSQNGKQTTLTDARGYKAAIEYDAFDRQTRWYLPSSTTPGVASTTDYEEYGYDAASNRTSLRKRDGSVISYQYDGLNRNISKIIPERAGLAATNSRDIYFGYDARGLQTFARFDGPSGEGLTTSYDGFGRAISSSLTMDGVTRTLQHGRDKNGNRTLLTYPDSNQVRFEYDGLDRLHVAYLGVSWFAYFDYNNRGQRSFQQGGGNSLYSYDSAGRLAGINHYQAAGGLDVSYTQAYGPAGQITSRSTSNDAYAWVGQEVNVDRNYSSNGLNQYTTAGPAVFAYDANGNLTSEGSTTFTYDVENRLVNATGAKNVALRYDPLGRLYETISGGVTTRFLYDGDELVGEYDASGNLLRRYVHGIGTDDPIVWFEGAGFNMNSMRQLRTDHRGSIVRVVDNAGNALINSYDEYGIPAANSVRNTVHGRFGYTGQVWVPELGLWYYKARFFSPTVGRFLQVDPVGYADQINLYSYAGNDPVNSSDPTGRWTCKGNGNQCLLARAFALGLQVAAKRGGSDDLKATVATLGVEGKGGPEIRFKALGEGTLGEYGNGTIWLDHVQIYDYAQNVAAGSGESLHYSLMAAGAGVLGHETKHYGDRSILKGGPANLMRIEKRAYRIEGEVSYRLGIFEGTGFKGPFNSRNFDISVDDMAVGSCAAVLKEARSRTPKESCQNYR